MPISLQMPALIKHLSRYAAAHTVFEASDQPAQNLATERTDYIYAVPSIQAGCLIISGMCEGVSSEDSGIFRGCFQDNIAI
jgi:hypothetical protein